MSTSTLRRPRTAEQTDTMFGDVIRLLHGDRPLTTDRLLYEAAVMIRDAMPDLDAREAMEVETILAYGVHLAGNLPAISDHAWSRVQSPAALRFGMLDGIEATVAACHRAITDRLASFRAAQLASEDGTAVGRLRELMEEQAALHPRLGLTFGYIGNCDFGGRYDDRSWKVFAKLATPRCANACDVSYGGVPTGQLGKLMQRAEIELAAWCDAQERRLDAGEIRIVGERA